MKIVEDPANARQQGMHCRRLCVVLLLAGMTEMFSFNRVGIAPRVLSVNHRSRAGPTRLNDSPWIRGVH